MQVTGFFTLKCAYIFILEKEQSDQGKQSFVAVPEQDKCKFFGMPQVRYEIKFINNKK